MFKTFLKWAAFPVLVASLLPFGIYWWYDSQYEEQAASFRERQLAVFEQAKKDVVYIQEYTPFADVHLDRARSAGPLLNDKVPWTGTPQDSPLFIDSATFDRLETEDYLELPADVWEGFDFGWMEEALAYDHWSVWDSGPVKKVSEDAEALLVDIPLPSYQHLMAWAKLRLLKAMSAGGEAQAIREVRHLARLMTTHETISGTLVAVAIWQMVDGFCDRQQIEVERRLPADYSDVLRRLTFYELGAMHHMAAPEVREYFAQPHGAWLGWCGAAYEVLVVTGIYQDSDLDEMSEVPKVRDMILNRSQCRFAPHVRNIPVPRLVDVASPQERMMMQMPLVKDIIFRILMTVAMPAPDSGYGTAADPNP